MKTLFAQIITRLQIHLSVKRALICVACGLGLMSGTAIAQPIQLDLGNGTIATNGAGFTKLSQAVYSVKNGSYYQWNNVAGTSYTLTMTNVNNYGGSGGPLNNDGFYNISGNGPAYFTVSNLPAGYTVTIYACAAWDGTGRGGKFEYGGVTNIVNTLGDMASPSVSTLQFVGRAVVGGDGTVSGRWYGQTGLTGEGQVGAMIFDVEPCQPLITVVGSNPLLVPVNSTFTDPGATAIESCSGSAVTVTTNGTVDATTIGTYTKTYTAIADGITNTATRTVNVVLSDFLNLDLAVSATDGSVLPSGFVRVSYTAANMTNSVVTVGGTTNKVVFTNVSGSYKGGGTTIDSSGFYCNSGATNGFYVTGLVPGSQVTLYACWAWDGANNAAIINWAGTSNLLNVGSGITLPSPSTFMNCGIEVADGAGTVSGTWTGKSGHQGQIGGMIFGIQAPVAHNITILPTGVTNSCGSSATFVASVSAGATYQWYNNFGVPITGATNTTLVLTNLHPSASGNYNFVATATNASWSATNFAVVSIYDVAPPVLTMNGNSQIILTLNSTWTDPGVTAYDTCAGNYLTVTTNGTVNTGVAGQYNLTYSATTGDGVSATNARTVIVFDPASAAPDYHLALDYGPVDENDYYPIFPDGFTKLLFGNLYINQWGNVSFPITNGDSSILINSFTNIGSWNTGTDYTNTLSTDGFANHGGHPATFYLSGVPVGQLVKIYAVYGWGGAAQGPQIIYGGATNTVTKGITVNSPAFPTEADFQYVGSAIATNGVVSGTFYGLGGPATEGQIGAMIYDVQSFPAHSIVISPAESTPQCGSNVTFTASPAGLGPFTYQWYDNYTNLIAGATNATYTLVNVRATSAGNYTVIAGNAYASATNHTIIDGVTDTQAPIMALNGPSTLNILINSTYVDAGASAYDLCAQGSLAMTTNSTVDTSTIGSYTVTYSATTANGTPGQIVRAVNVVAIPNLSLNLDFASTDGGVPAAPAGYTLLRSAVNLASVANYSWPNVAGSIYTLSISNISQYNTGNTNEPLTTSGFYKSAGNNYPATFTLSGLQPTLKVTCYAIHAWDPAFHYADVYFGGTHAIAAGYGDPGQNPVLTNFTRIGATYVDSTGIVSGYWQGSTSGETNQEGHVGAMVFVIGTNTPPAASNLVMNAVGAHSATLQIIGNAAGPTDPDGDPLTLTAVQTNIGAVTISSNSVIYTAPSAYNGVDTFNYTVSDGFGGTATGTVTVTVTSNSPPAVSAISINATNGHLATLKIIGGASAPTDANGDAMLVTAVQNPSDHSGTVATDGTNATYVSSYVGTDHFTYTVGDGHGGFSTATVTVTVADTNHPPVASNLVMNAVGAHPATLLIVGNPSGPTDPDGNTLTLTAVQTNIGSVGSVTITGNSAIYTAPGTYNGADTFNYTVSDGLGGVSTGTVTVTVTANSPPAVSAISLNATNSQTATLQIIGGANAPTDANGDALLVTAVQNPSDHGGTVATDGTNATYVSTYVGTDHFTYTVGDGHGGFSTATVTVSVADTNQPPVASNMVMNAVGAHPTTLQIVGNPSGPTDPNGHALTLSAVQTNIGSATISSNSVIYTAPGAYNGADTFTYTVTNAFGGTATGTVTVTVTSNSPPVASAISLNATNGHLATLQIIGGASAPTDADGDALLVTAVQNPSDHSGTVTTDGTNVTYVSSYVGTDHFTYTVGDGYGGFVTATITVTVADTNQPPVAGPQVMGAVSGQSATLKIIGGANPPTDSDNDPLTITAVTTPGNGTAGTDGTNVTYASANGFTGSDTFNYVVGDGRGAFATNSVTVSVVSATGYNRLAAPVRSGGSYNVGFNGIPYVHYVLLTTTNLAPPVTWSPVQTNQADGNSGVTTFSFTPSAGKGFYKAGSLP